MDANNYLRLHCGNKLSLFLPAVESVWRREGKKGDSWKFYILYYLYGKNGTYSLGYDKQETWEKDYNNINKALSKLQNKTGGFTMDSLKRYLNVHQDALITLAIIILLDHFLFDGQFREKIKGSVEGLLNKTTKKLEEGKDE